MPKTLKILKTCLFWVLLMPVLGVATGIALLEWLWYDISDQDEKDRYISL
jgi:hypothetical protein